MEAVLFSVMCLNQNMFWWCNWMTFFCFGDVVVWEQVWWLSINLQSNKVTAIGQFFLTIKLLDHYGNIIMIPVKFIVDVEVEGITIILWCEGKSLTQLSLSPKCVEQVSGTATKQSLKLRVFLTRPMFLQNERENPKFLSDNRIRKCSLMC